MQPKISLEKINNQLEEISGLDIVQQEIEINKLKKDYCLTKKVLNQRLIQISQEKSKQKKQKQLAEKKSKQISSPSDFALLESRQRVSLRQILKGEEEICFPVNISGTLKNDLCFWTIYLKYKNKFYPVVLTEDKKII